jgi:Protein of unknown function (DUF2804)
MTNNQYISIMQVLYDTPLQTNAIKFDCSCAAKKLRQKKWQFISIISPDINLSITLNNVGLFHQYSIFFGNLNTSTTYYFHKYAPPWTVQVPDNSVEGTALVNTKHFKVTLSYHFKEGYYTMHLEHSNKKTNVSADFKIYVDGLPLCHTTYLKPHRPIYQHHASNYYAVGSVEFNGEKFKLSKLNNTATFDYTKGIYPLTTSWRWIAGGGYSNDHKVSFNMALINSRIVCGCYWIDGKRELISNVVFSKLSGGNWEATADGGAVKISFTKSCSVIDKLCKISYLYNCGKSKVAINDCNYEGIASIVEEFYAIW